MTLLSLDLWRKNNKMSTVELRVQDAETGLKAGHKSKSCQPVAVKRDEPKLKNRAQDSSLQACPNHFIDCAEGTTVTRLKHVDCCIRHTNFWPQILVLANNPSDEGNNIPSMNGAKGEA
ncbi:hypothetical protein Y1Q_0022237 [Alligator mississippiensis]|uniref:Uncharacterized protein n=1 Tax=Alligator mississippiensis TaxID=8496 RepID=A0A151NZS7_ALLMI|nr:hypothetical protein Y1Q_0022237 [Alligator mississippiensis]